MGSVVVSVDAELGWGFHDLEPLPDHRVEAASTGWSTLLDLFEKHQVSATWAVVGHLFLEECDGVHADHPTPEGWFDRDAAWAARPDLRFGDELIARLLASPVDHDIGCHTFSHVICTDDWVTRDVFRAELAAAAAAARPHGVEFRSFVYPRNAVAHRDLLAEAGYTCYRGAAPDDGGSLRRIVRKLADTAAPDRVPLVQPSRDEYGLVNVPPSLFLFGLQGAARSALEPVVGDPVVRQATAAIDRAAHGDGVFHAWLHPNNLVDERDVARIDAILAHVRDRVDDTDLSVRTMSGVADAVGADPGDDSRPQATTDR